MPVLALVVLLLSTALAAPPGRAEAAAEPPAGPSTQMPADGNVFFLLETLAEGTAVRAGWVASKGRLEPLAWPGHQYLPEVVYAEGRKRAPLNVPARERTVETPCGNRTERLIPAQTKAAFATLVPLAGSFPATADTEAKARAVEAVAARVAKAAPGAGLDPASLRVLPAGAADLDGDGSAEVLVAAWVRPRNEPDVPGAELVLPFWVGASAGAKGGKPGQALVLLDGLLLAQECSQGDQPTADTFHSRTAGIHDFDDDGLPEFGLTTRCGHGPPILTVFKHQNGRLEPVYRSPEPPGCGGN